MKKYQQLLLTGAGSLGALGLGAWIYKKVDLANRLPLGQYQIQPTLNDLKRTQNSQQILQWQTDNGTFKGWEDEKVIRVQGIRYAISERYGNPEPYTYPDGVIEKVTPAPISAQNRSGFEEFYAGVNYEEIEQDELGQYLSITLPKDIVEDEKLPVLIWIHGGGYHNGGIDIKSYDPQLLVSEHRLIVVSISYRLGVLGYLRDREGQYANLGLLDQIEALKWVHRNIGYFGGDSQNVTIYGESAGANAVQYLMISEGTEDLFQRVMIASSPFATMEEREEMNRQMLEAYLELPIDATLSEILAKQNEIIARIDVDSYAKNMFFAPHYGVYPLPTKEEAELAWQAACERLDVLIGATTREAAAFIGEDSYLKLAGSVPGVKRLVEQKIIQLSHAIFIDGAEDFAHKYANATKSMYYYVMTWGEGHLLGASHTIDLSLTFGNNHPDSPILLGKTKSEVDYYGRQFRIVLADFIKTGQIHTYEIPDVVTFEHLGAHTNESQ